MGLNLQESYNGKILRSFQDFHTDGVKDENVDDIRLEKVQRCSTMANRWRGWNSHKATSTFIRRYIKRDSPLSNSFRELSFKNVHRLPPSHPQTPRFVCMSEVAMRTGQVHHSSK